MNERKDKKKKKKQKITPNLGTKLEEETQKNMETVTGENQLKKEQDLEMKSEEDTQKNTHTVTGENQLKKEQDSDKAILHKDNNFGTTLVPNQPDGILKQVQKTQVKTQHNRKRRRQTTQQKNLKKPRVLIKSQLEEIKQVREKYKATKDQLDKATLSALVQSISEQVKSWRQKEIHNGGLEKLKVITHESKKIKTVSIRKSIKLSDRAG